MIAWEGNIGWALFVISVQDGKKVIKNMKGFGKVTVTVFSQEA